MPEIIEGSIFPPISLSVNLALLNSIASCVYAGLKLGIGKLKSRPERAAVEVLSQASFLLLGRLGAFGMSKERLFNWLSLK